MNATSEVISAIKPSQRVWPESAIKAALTPRQPTGHHKKDEEKDKCFHCLKFG
ncbi:MAG: hypothetical protein HC880_09765 [Bacteroidia bacterium]|nr:hypothetical protein [Bacteroidia bacterium]